VGSHETKRRVFKDAECLKINAREALRRA
jgi:hypothetical protein